MLSTLGSDVGTLVVLSVLAVWCAEVFANFPVADRIIEPFERQPQGGILFFVALTPYWIAALWAFGLYRDPGRSIRGTAIGEGVTGLTALTSAAWCLLIVLVFVQGEHAPIAPLIVLWLFAVAVMPLSRRLVRRVVWARPRFAERTLIVGAGEVGHTLADKISRHPEYRVSLVGFLDDGEPRRGGECACLPILGSLGDLSRVIAEKHVDRVVVAFSQARTSAFLRVVRSCADAGVKVNIVPRLFEVVSSRALVDDIEGIPLLDVGHVELGRFSMVAKRVFDLIVGGAMMIVMLPLLGGLALAIKLDSRGPVFFRQERMGRGGKTFRIFKFRSMYVGAERDRRALEHRNDYDGPMFKLKKDPRVTRVGGWMRRWSLDELPQIFNVMSGRMSLVGPRPLWVEEAKQCRGWTKKRLDITPGITGLWQVLGRSNIPFDEMVKLDYMYVTGWSMSWDVKLLLQTVPAVLEKRGAY